MVALVYNLRQARQDRAVKKAGSPSRATPSGRWEPRPTEQQRGNRSAASTPRTSPPRGELSPSWATSGSAATAQQQAAVAGACAAAATTHEPTRLCALAASRWLLGSGVLPSLGPLSPPRAGGHGEADAGSGGAGDGSYANDLATVAHAVAAADVSSVLAPPLCSCSSSLRDPSPHRGRAGDWLHTPSTVAQSPPFSRPPNSAAAGPPQRSRPSPPRSQMQQGASPAHHQSPPTQHAQRQHPVQWLPPPPPTPAQRTPAASRSSAAPLVLRHSTGARLQLPGRQSEMPTRLALPTRRASSPGGGTSQQRGLRGTFPSGRASTQLSFCDDDEDELVLLVPPRRRYRLGASLARWCAARARHPPAQLRGMAQALGCRRALRSWRASLAAAHRIKARRLTEVCEWRLSALLGSGGLEPVASGRALVCRMGAPLLGRTLRAWRSGAQLSAWEFAEPADALCERRRMGIKPARESPSP